MMMMMIDDVPE